MRVITIATSGTSVRSCKIAVLDLLDRHLHLFQLLPPHRLHHNELLLLLEMLTCIKTVLAVRNMIGHIMYIARFMGSLKLLTY